MIRGKRKIILGALVLVLLIMAYCSVLVIDTFPSYLVMIEGESLSAPSWFGLSLKPKEGEKDLVMEVSANTR